MFIATLLYMLHSLPTNWNIYLSNILYGRKVKRYPPEDSPNIYIFYANFAQLPKAHVVQSMQSLTTNCFFTTFPLRIISQSTWTPRLNMGKKLVIAKHTRPCLLDCIVLDTLESSRRDG